MPLSTVPIYQWAEFMSPQTAANTIDLPAGADDRHGVGHDRLPGFEHGPAPVDAAEPVRETTLDPEVRDEIARWLEWQCQMLAGVQRGVVFLCSRSRSGVLESAGVWPTNQQPSRALKHTAERAAAENRSIIKKALDEVGNGTEVLDYIGQPLVQKGVTIGVVSLALEVRSDAQRRAVLQLLEWGVNWLDVTLSKTNSGSAAGASLAFDCTARLAEDYPLPVVCHELCNLLATRLDCARVAVGLTEGLQVRVVALSHQVRFDRRVNRVAAIEAAMEECADQGVTITVPVPAGDESGVIRAHAQLLRDSGDDALCSVPLEHDERVIGVLTLVRDAGQPFDATTIATLTAMAPHLTPVLALKHREARSAWSKALHGMGDRTKVLLGGGYVRFKLTVAFILSIVAGLLFIQTDRQVSAPSSIEGRIQQVVAAPFAGYIQEAPVRAGDEVKEGQALLRIDDRELLLEQEKLTSERDKQAREYQEALAGRERSKVSVIRAQIDQTEARLRLIDDRLGHAVLRAPFAGTVVSGDLSRSLGAPIERGQSLFELVPDAGYRVAMQVDEYDVADLEPGQTGELRLAGMPTAPVPITVSRIVPIADAAQGTNLFRVEGEIPQPPDDLRPGMQGVAKVVVGKGSVLQVWTHSLVRRLQLWFWSIGF